MSLAGGTVDAGLIASVAVPPEHRRRGYGRQMMGALLAELHDLQTPLSLLFPFSVAWYRSLGYGVANFTWFMDIAPRLLPDFAERYAVRRAFPDDEPGIRACHAAAMSMPQNNGWLARGDWEWQKRVWKPEHEVVVYVEQGRVEGYLVYTLTFGSDPSSARVIEWVSTSDAAWRGLAGFLSALGEQATVLTFNAPQQSPLLWVLREPYDRTAGRLILSSTRRRVLSTASWRGSSTWSKPWCSAAFRPTFRSNSCCELTIPNSLPTAALFTFVSPMAKPRSSGYPRRRTGRTALLPRVTSLPSASCMPARSAHKQPG